MTPVEFIDKLQIIAAVNDEKILANNLRRSLFIKNGQVDLQCYRGESSISIAYNKGLDNTSKDILVFAHQDVYFPEDWPLRLGLAISDIETHDPNWAVIGACGLNLKGAYVGHVWSSGLGTRIGGNFNHPVEASSIDELVIVLRRASNIRFDNQLPNFHLYGTDIICTAKAAGRKSYIANIPVIHNSRPVRSYRGGYADAWHFMRRKWHSHLPIPTLTVPITKSIHPLIFSQLRLWSTRRARIERSFDPDLNPEDLLKHLDDLSSHTTRSF